MAGCGDGIIDGESNIIYGMSVCERETAAAVDSGARDGWLGRLVTSVRDDISLENG